MVVVVVGHFIGLRRPENCVEVFLLGPSIIIIIIIMHSDFFVYFDVQFVHFWLNIIITPL